MRTQEQVLLHHLQKHGTITRREADTEYSIQSLTRRISTLRADGYIISRVFKRNPVTEQRYAQYTLETKPLNPATGAEPK